jgi:hypothetical protein
MDKHATALTGTEINPLGCRNALISFEVMNLAQYALMGGLRRGKARLPVSFGGVLQRVMAYGPAIA